jgi:Mg2+ and Co2+ transporter CorA
MVASEFFADQAQRSSRMMESLTHQMHDIAMQTKQETVSMRIITLVTLFFLPGTFVAVL